MSWLNLTTWLPCVFCEEQRATHHKLCEFCWKNLPWDQQINTRQEVQFTASCYYDYPMDRVIHQFKDQAKLHYLPLLSACLLSLPKPKVDAIVPMPLSTEKLISRGFSQTYLLAHTLSKQWQIPIWQPISRQDGHSQRGLDREQRLANLSNNFYINQSNKKKYRKVIMLDDVITTGASLFSLQQQLIE